MKKRTLLMLLSGMLLLTGGLVSCDDNNEDGKDSLTVLPSNDIEFDATANDDVKLQVSTSASSWEVADKPSWVTATKDGNTLIVNASDNSSGTRSGRIQITAGTADAVYIGVSQKKADDYVEPSDDAVAGSLQTADDEKEVSHTFDGDDDFVSKVYFSIDQATEAGVEVEVFVDSDYVAEYNLLNNTSYELFPESLVSLSDNGTLTITAGSRNSRDLEVTLAFDEELNYTSTYMLPLWVKAKTSNVKISSDCRVNYYLVKRKNPREVQNILYFEVNDVNPLNALEFVLEDGTPFFDAVILFSSNINYNSETDLVYLWHNYNVQLILDDVETYVRPLQRAGIKVYMSLLGNHDAAGICNLSEWGCQQYGRTLALDVEQYGLDGICFDDEYSGSPISGNPWFASFASSTNGSRLMKETKLAMKEICGEDKDIVIFQYSSLSNPPAVDGYDQSEFIDINTANYGNAGWPLGNQTLKNCAGMSVELSRGSGSTDESTARNVKSQGYGWFMWFNLNPNNYWLSIPKLQNVARGLYDKEMLAPTHYYKKVTDVSIDPTRYEIDF